MLPEHWLPDALSTDPFVATRLVLVKGWETRTRGYGLSTVRQFVTCHHTADTLNMSTAASLSVIINGNSVAPGPIAPLLISREPKVYLVAAGTCNHRGAGRDEDGGSGNARSIGIEVMNNGHGERWADEQVELYARTVACILRWKRWGIERVHHHWTYAPERKEDPKGPAQWNGEHNDKWPKEAWRTHVGVHLLSIPPKSLTLKENLVLTILQCSDADAAFLAYTANGVAAQIEWADPDTFQRFKAAGVGAQSVSREQLRNCTLLGPLPVGDQRFTWTSQSFRRHIPAV